MLREQGRGEMPGVEIKYAPHEIRVDLQTRAIKTENLKSDHSALDFGYDVQVVTLPTSEDGVGKKEVIGVNVTDHEGKKLFDSKYHYAEINGKLVRKAKEYTFGDGTKQLIVADYDNNGRVVEYRSEVNGKVIQYNKRTYNENGQLVRIEYMDSDIPGEMTGTQRTIEVDKNDSTESPFFAQLARPNPDSGHQSHVLEGDVYDVQKLIKGK